MIDRWEVLVESHLRVTTENLTEGLYVTLAPVADGGVNFAFGVEILKIEQLNGKWNVLHKRHKIVVVYNEPVMVLGSGVQLWSSAEELGLVVGRPHPFVCIANDQTDLVRVSKDPILILA